MATKKKKKNGSLLTIACSLLAILVVLVIFLTKKNTIVTNLKETSFFDRAFGTTPEFVKNHEPEKTEKKQDVIELNNSEVTIKIESEEAPIPEEKLAAPKDEIKTEEIKIKEQEKPVVAEKSETSEKTEKSEKVSEKQSSQSTQKTEKKSETKTEKKAPAQTQIQLCFVEINGDGSVSRRIVKRSVPKNNSPLTYAINELLKGPSLGNSSEKNCMSLIPSGTKLLSAKVQNGIAYLNFNENFDINPYGVEGYVNQLMQIVYTATSFSTVTSVQFLIEGEKREYLGSEGQWIGSPLSRNSF